MSQPPEANMRSDSQSSPSSQPPQWRRPRGVAPGTWEYVNQRSIADHYDAFVANTPLCLVDAEVLSDVLPGVGSNQPELVLDLGCGSGRASLPLASRGYDVIAVDLSRQMLQILLSKSSEMSLAGRILPVRANIVELDCIAERSADHAICLFSTLGMVQGRANRREVLRHVAGIVRPGGSFLVHVHNRWAALREPSGFLSLAESWWKSIRNSRHDFGDATYAYRGLENMFMHRYGRGELTRDLSECGWKIVQFWPLSIDGSRIDREARIPGGFIVHCTHALSSMRP